MRKLLLIAVLLMLPAVASAYVTVDTDFENANLGTVHGQTFDGGAWTCPWYGGTNEANIINVEATFAGRGQVLAFQTTGAKTRAVVTRTDGIVPPAVDYNGNPAYLDGTTIMEFDFYAASNAQGDWTNLMAQYSKGMWQYFEPSTDTIELWDYTGAAGWDWTNPGLLTYSAGPLPLDQWFGVRIEYTNMNDGAGTPISGTYDYYVNGVLVGDDIPGDPWGVGERYIEFNLVLNEAYDNPGGYVMIDKVKWSYEPVPEPSILLLGGVGLLALLRRKK